jgi:endonuclease/exonuclease/phosphatase (EEP) superfamily protein YafD
MVLRVLLCTFIFMSPLATARVGGPCELDVTSPSSKLLLPELPSKFTVAVWNVHKFMNPKSVADLAAILNQSDLVLVQESVVNKIFSGAMSHVSHNMQWAFGTTFQTREGLTGVVTGCRALANRNDVVRSLVREPFLRTPKAMIFSQFRMEGADEDLLVINVHAINFVNLRKFGRQIRQISDRVARHNGPVVVAGDFNTWSRGRLKVLEEALNPLGVELAHSAGGRYLTLDHILTRGLRLVSVLDTTGVRSSDHAPLAVELEIER